MVPVISYFVLIGCLYCFGLTILVEKSFYQRHTIKHLIGSGCNETQNQFLRFQKNRFPRNQRPMLIKIKLIKKQSQPIEDRILKEKKKKTLSITQNSF